MKLPECKIMEKLEKVIRKNGKYHKKFACGLSDRLIIYPKDLAIAISKYIRDAKPKEECSICNGQGWTAEHDPGDPHPNGECQWCPIQVQCETCLATGKNLQALTEWEANLEKGQK